MKNKINICVVSIIAMLVAGVARSEEFATKDYVDAQDTKLANRTVDLRKALVTTVEDVQLSSGDNGVIPHMMTQDQRVKYIRNLITGFDSSSTSQANPLGVITTPLQTEAQTAFGAINELKDAIDNIDIPEQVQPDWNATTGKAAILNKPNIPDAQVQSDWNATEGMGVIKNKPTLATVATSGSYNDLTDKPAAQDLTGYATEAYVNTQIGELDIPAAQVQSDWNATEGMGAIKNKPTLATVATSGSYNDLDDKPTIPSIEGLATTQELTSGLAGKQNSLTEAQLAAANSGITAEKVASYDGYATTIAAKADASDLEGLATTEALTSGLAGKQNSLTEAQLAAANSGITAEKVASYDGYATTIAAKADGSDLSALDDRVDAVEDAIGTGSMTVNGANQATIVAAINALDTKTNGMATDQNLTDLQNNVTTLATTVGNTSLATTAQTVTGAVNELNTAVGGKQDTISDIATIRSGAALGATAVQDEDLAAVATSGDYDDLINKPTMPTVDNALNAQSSNAIANSAVASKLVSTAPGSGEYVLGYVNGTPTYIAVVGAE